MEDHSPYTVDLIFIQFHPIRLKEKVKGKEKRYGGSFGWGGGLQKSNEGAQRFPGNQWTGLPKCKSIRKLNCKRDISSRYMSIDLYKNRGL